MDAPDIRALADLQQTCDDLRREVDATTSSLRAVDALAISQRATIDALRAELAALRASPVSTTTPAPASDPSWSDGTACVGGTAGCTGVGVWATGGGVKCTACGERFRPAAPAPKEKQP